MKKSKVVIAILLTFILVSSFIGCSPSRKPLPKKLSKPYTTNRTNKSSTTNTTEKFLTTNRQTIDFNVRSAKSPYSLLDNSIKNKQVFFLGEIHGIENNENIDFELLKYLHNKVGINYYLAEMGYSSAFFINRYLDTGNENYLKSLFSDFEGTIGWTKEGYNSWKELYSYNKSLPKNRRIKVVGIDLEHQYELGIMQMNEILPNKSVPTSIKPMIDEIISINKTKNFDPKTLKDFVVRLKADMKAKPSIYKGYLGKKKMFDFQQITQNIINDFEFAKIESDWYKSNNLRDKLIFDNFNRIYSQLPKGSKFYGLWGRPHTFQGQIDKINYVASLMKNKNSKVKNKVLSVTIYYKDCSRIAVNNSGYVTEAYSDEGSITNPLNKAANANINIFRLTGTKSPFKRGLSLVEEPTGGGSTVDYFQYIILIKNAGPSSPLGK